MLAVTVVDSEDSLVGLIAGRPLVWLDGVNGAGKSDLARRLAPRLGATLIHCDALLLDGTKHFPDGHDLAELRARIAAAERMALVDGAMARLFTEALQLDPFHVYVRHNWPPGQHTHAEHFDRTACRAAIEEGEQLLREMRVDPRSPILPLEVLRYHERFEPHLHAHAIFDLAFGKPVA